MRNKSVQRQAQTISVIGIEHIHTHYGNLYRVVSHPSQEFTEYYLYSGVCEPLFGIWDMGECWDYKGYKDICKYSANYRY